MPKVGWITRALDEAAPLQEEEVREDTPDKQYRTRSTTNGDYVEIAEILTSHGIKGEVRVRSLTDFPAERLEKPGTRYLQMPGRKAARAGPTKVRLKRGKETFSRGHSAHILKLEGFNTPEEALELAGGTLLIRKEARLPLEDSDFEFYVQDLIGLRVFLQEDGSEIGVVQDVYDGTGTYDLLKVELTEGEKAGATSLIPFAKAIVPVVDLQGGRMELDPPAGLLELARLPKQSSAKPPRRKKREGKRGDLR
ncbi:hypothetical protein CYMTET_20299, partial [Cymbomonas tetramitiformis]